VNHIPHALLGFPPLQLTGWAFLALGVLCLALFALGRRVDRIPRCRRCKYPKPDNTGTCPECGRDLFKRFALAKGLRRRSRPLLLGAVPLLLLGTITTMFAMWESQPSDQPGWKLLADLYISEPDRQSLALNELAFRFEQATLPEWQQAAFVGWAFGTVASPETRAGWQEHDIVTRAAVRGLTSNQENQVLVESLVGALKDDNERFNARYACEHLTDLGSLTFNPLMDALDSEDRQQRQYAATVLGRIPGAPHPTRLYQVWVESLRDDGNWSYRTGIYNASESLGKLFFHVGSARRELVDALDSDDPQQRYLAAYILGATGQSDLAGEVAPVLLPHLRDNDIANDAMAAAVALYRLGGPVEPYLTEALADADEQQRSAIELILWDLESPPVTNYDFEQRRKMCRLSPNFRDPLIEMNPQWIRIPRFPRPE